MATKPPVAPGKRLVWRMDANHPSGALVDADEPVAKAAVVDENQPQGWQDSSLALQDGLHVSETPLDSLPGELLDLFSTAPATTPTRR